MLKHVLLLMMTVIAGSLCAVTAQSPDSAVAPTPGTIRELSDPTTADLFFIYYSILGKGLPYAELVSADPRVKAATEFNRTDVSSKVETEIRAKALAVRGIGILRTNIDASFGEYDSRYKEYNLGFGNGYALSFQGGPGGRDVSLVLTNGGFAASWTVEPADAQDILRRSDNDRRVVLAAKLEILNAQPVVNDRTLTLNVRILEYVIWSNSKHIQLGKVVVKR